jgi:hypothetical protein
VLAELNRVLWALADDHRALVADVHARFLGHGLAAGDPTQPPARPRDRGLWYCRLTEPNAWGASEIRASFWEALLESGHRVVMTVLAAQAPPGRERRSDGEPSSRRSTLEVEVTPRGQAGVARDRQPAALTGRVVRTIPDSGGIGSL